MRDTGFVGALKHLVKTNPIFRPATAAWWGTQYSWGHFLSKAARPYLSILRTGEVSNFVYPLTEGSLGYMEDTIAAVTGESVVVVSSYVHEALADPVLTDHLHRAGQGGPELLGRRLGWYAIVRIAKPRLIVETGVERGHGSVTLCAALLRNTAEGYQGRYIGTDIDPHAGRLLTGQYTSVGKIMYGDSIESLKKIDEPIDLFVNDSDHSAAYEENEYRAIRETLSDRAIILSDNAHVTDCLHRFARETGRRFLFFKERPKGHWYPGGGIGIAWLLNRG